MGLDLSTLANKRASRTFDFDGEKVTITFNPHTITPEYRVQLAALADKAKNEDAGAGGEEGYRSTLKEAGGESGKEEQKQQDAMMIADLLNPEKGYGWDVILNGTPYPPTYENLLPVPVTLLGRVSSEIMEVIQELSNPIRKKK